jgi:hypothetical protein
MKKKSTSTIPPTQSSSFNLPAGSARPNAADAVRDAKKSVKPKGGEGKFVKRRDVPGKSV